MTNPARITPPTMYREMIGHEPHGYCVPPQEVASNTVVRPSPRVTKPTQSRECFLETWGRWKNTMMNASAATPMGRLIKKSHRHEKASVIQPPANGPAIEAMPKTPPRYPMYLPRSRGLMMSPIIVWESGMMVP